MLRQSWKGMTEPRKVWRNRERYDGTEKGLTEPRKAKSVPERTMFYRCLSILRRTAIGFETDSEENSCFSREWIFSDGRDFEIGWNFWDSGFWERIEPLRSTFSLMRRFFDSSGTAKGTAQGDCGEVGIIASVLWWFGIYWNWRCFHRQKHSWAASGTGIRMFCRYMTLSWFLMKSKWFVARVQSTRNP
jgi:hypothetical protein